MTLIIMDFSQMARYSSINPGWHSLGINGPMHFEVDQIWQHPEVGHMGREGEEDDLVLVC